MIRNVILLLGLLVAFVNSSPALDVISRRQKPVPGFKNGGFDLAQPFKYWKPSGDKGSTLDAPRPGYNGTRAQAGLTASTALDAQGSSIRLSQTFSAHPDSALIIIVVVSHYCYCACCGCYSPCGRSIYVFYFNGVVIHTGMGPPSGHANGKKFDTISVPAAASKSGSNNLTIAVTNFETDKPAGYSFDSISVTYK